MVTLGADTHKSTHTVVAIDDLGRKLDELTVRATPAGHVILIDWAKQFDERKWALEDVRHLSRCLEIDLLRSSEKVVRVHTRLMGQARRSGRTRGKSDSIDALATARAALREPGLPEAFLEGEEREIRLLVDHREDFVAERTRFENRLLWDLHELFPGSSVAPRSLGRAATLARIEQQLTGTDGVVASIARDRLEEIRRLNTKIHQLEREIESLAKKVAPSLLELQGCGPLTAAKLIGETARAGRYRSKSAFARANGTAPIPVSSGKNDRQRLNRGGNRQINCALHRIAITQMRLEGKGHQYVQRRLQCGNTKTEAIRALRRRISDEVFRRMIADEQSRAGRAATCVPAAA
jgi:transposase